MKFNDQFTEVPEPIQWPGYPDDLFTPVEGFTGEHVESIAHLVRRLEAGEFVSELEDGLTHEDQVFQSEFTDPFDVLDLAQNAEIAPNTSATRPAVPDPGIAVPEGPSPNSGADKPGDRETA